MRILIALSFSVTFFGFIFSQTQLDTVRFNSGWQGMFNASNDPNPYDLNEWLGLPTSGPVGWDEGFTWNAPGFSTGGFDLGPFGYFPGFGFGASFYMTTEGYFGIGLDIHDFENDSLMVNYPVKVTTNYSPDYSFDYGDWVGLKTSYNVLNVVGTPDTFFIDSRYPTGGAVDFTMGAYVGAHIGASLTVEPFGTLSYDFLSLDFGQPETNIFHVTEDTSYYYGEANPFALPSLPVGPGGSLVPQPDPGFSAIPGYPDGYPDIAFPACGDLQALIPGACQIAQVWVPEPPISGSLGPIDGDFSLPYVDLDETTLFGPGLRNMRAIGDSTYIDIEMDLFKLLASIISNTCGTGVADGQPPGTPNPYCVAAEVILGNLSNSIEQSIPGLDEDLQIWYNLISARFVLSVTNKQRFEFKPTVRGKYSFLTPVQFKVYNSLGVLYQNNTGNQINYIVGDSISIKYPCFYEDFSVERAYTIDGTINSKTYDSIDFSFIFDGLGFGLVIPGFTIIPSYTFSFCIPYGYPCGSVFWPSWCTGEWCESFSTPSIGFPTLSWNTCSLYGVSNSTCSIEFVNESLGNWTNVWHEKEWALEGFDPFYPVDPIILRGRPLLVDQNNTIVNNVSCYGGTGSIVVAIQNGTLPFNVSWNNGPTSIVASNIFTSPTFPAGTYVASISDANGCQIYAGGEILQPQEQISVVPLLTHDSCNDAVGNGAININTLGGTPNYTYSWTGSGTAAPFSSTSQNISGLKPGQYNLTITDSKACTYSAVYTITQPSLINDGSEIVVPTKCFGDNTGEVIVQMNGGVLPYASYTWRQLPSNTIVGNLESLSGVPAGTYQLTVVDNLGCTYVNQYAITQPTDITLSTAITNATCYNSNNGQVVVSAVGGIPGGYSYEWYNGNNVLLSSTSNTISNLTAGNYSVEVRDGNGCLETIMSTVNQPTEIVVTNSVIQNVNCFGNNTGSISVDVLGGVPSYTYDWSNDGLGIFDDPQDLSGLISGTYTLIVRDQNLCSKTYSYNVTQPSQALSVSQVPTNVLCYGNTTGSIAVTVNGGTAPYSYDWNMDGTGDFNDNLNASNLSAGTYAFVVQDNNGCLANFTSTINQPTNPLSVTETHADVLCYGGNSGSIDITPFGGTTPYNYSWSNGGTVLLTTTSQDLTNLAADVYQVNITDAHNCTSSLSISVGQPSEGLSIINQITSVDCNGNSTGSIDVTVSGGTLNYTYDWSNDGLGDNNDAEDLLNALADNYTLSVTDQNGCTLAANYTISQPIQAIQLAVVPKPVLCFGESTGGMDLMVSGGTSPYTFDWNNDGVGDNDDEQNLTLVSSGIYTVNVTDINGCSQSIGGFVSQPAQALGVTPLNIEPSCFGYEDGSIELTISGGTTPYYMQWGNNSEYLLNNPSELLSGLGKGVYFFRVRDKNNCIVEQYVNIGQPDTLDVANLVTDVNCFNGTDGSIDLTTNGGTAPYTYLWSNGGVTEDLNGLPSDYYTFLLTDANGCIFQDVVFVNQAPDISIAFQVTPLSCTDQTDAAIEVQTAGGTQPYDWLWSNGANTGNIYNLSGGQYDLTIVDDHNCTKSYTFFIDSTNVECISLVNSFTPNGDDYNDTWIIKNMHLYPKAQVKIFNRWGNLLYETNGEYVPWNGKYKGSDLPSEVYYYIIVLNNGVNNQYTGTVTIIR